MFKKCKQIWPEILIFSGLLIISAWLMISSFSYESSTGSLLISTKAWSDFAYRVPLIRSFSLGNNFPPQDPLFPGEPLRYHALFYLLVGLLEKTGLRIDWALNIPSIISFWFLTVMIYALAFFLFKKRIVAVLSVIFFLFNSSLSFVEFFKSYPMFSLKTYTDILPKINVFPSFGPYDQKIVSAFWNLNVYTNQRHFALGLFIILVLVFVLAKNIWQKQKIKSLKIIMAGVILGLMPTFHAPLYVMGLAIFGCWFLLFPGYRKPMLIFLIIAAIIGLPQIYLFKSGATGEALVFKPGYLIADRLDFTNFINYWFLNLGLNCFLIPLGFYFADKNAKKLLLSFVPLFAIANTFQFSMEMAANHKFFNLYLILGNMFSAFALYKIWNFKIGKFIVPVFMIIMVFSGIIDFLVLKNDYYLKAEDQSSEVQWIENNIPANSIILTSTYLYHPASLAGRKIFFGWPYFAWSFGFDTNTRGQIVDSIFNSKDRNFICQQALKNKLDYVALYSANNDFPVSLDFWQKNFSQVSKNPKTGFIIYDFHKSCS
jgi:hypothetical protein